MHEKEFKDLVEQDNDLLLEWPVAERHYILAEKILPCTSDTIRTLPLRKDDLFLSFARLGRDGEPSVESILRWVDRHGLLHAQESAQIETLEEWGTHRIANEHVPKPAPITLREFRTEVRTAYQLVTLYRDIKARDAEAVIGRYVNLPDRWRHTDSSPVDQHLDYSRETARKEYQVSVEQAGQKRRADLEQTPGVNVEALYLHDSLGILIRCVNRKLWNIRPG